jgi:hypothetical protein
MKSANETFGAECRDWNGWHCTALKVLRTAITALICLSAFCLAFWFYGYLRTGAFHFSLGRFILFLAIAVLLPLVPVVSLIFSEYCSSRILGSLLTLVPMLWLYTVFTFPDLLVFLIPAALTGVLFFLNAATRKILGLVCSSLVIGGVASELTILHDEARFEREVARLTASREYFRARAWPNQSRALVFNPGVGINCID